MFSFFRPKPPSIEALRAMIMPLLAGHIDVSLGDIRVKTDCNVIIVLNIHRHNPAHNDLQKTIETHVKKQRGMQKVLVILTQESAPTPPPPPPSPPIPPSPSLPPLVIAVASGKGGVGKSTIAINLAAGLHRLGLRVGVLDADIYGPSLPRLVGQPHSKAIHGDDGRLMPVMAHGLKTMSMGYLVDEETAMIWRGPMAQSALLQMIRDVNWDGLDILVIDMPPGTGDIHLTLAQKVTLSGGVVVSTPQDIALIDARKGIEMFKKVAVPLLGMVENMAFFCCPQCGHREPIFGSGGAQAEAQKIGIPCLASIPLHTRLREISDAGVPITLSSPESSEAEAFITLAKNVMTELDKTRKPAPTIRMED